MKPPPSAPLNSSALFRMTNPSVALLTSQDMPSLLFVSLPTALAIDSPNASPSGSSTFADADDSRAVTVATFLSNTRYSRPSASVTRQSTWSVSTTQWSLRLKSFTVLQGDPGNATPSG